MDETQIQEERDWGLLKQTYIEWLTLPADQRDPQTKAEVAEILGVHKRTLRRWELDESFNAQRMQHMVSNFLPYTPDVIQAIYRSAIKGSALSQKLWMEVVEKMASELNVYIKGEIVHHVDYAQVLEIIREKPLLIDDSTTSKESQLSGS